jgi:hypothetical protein
MAEIKKDNWEQKTIEKIASSSLIEQGEVDDGAYFLSLLLFYILELLFTDLILFLIHQFHQMRR